MKQCKTCKISFPLEEFYNHPQTKDSHYSECKKCVGIRTAIRYRKNPKRQAEWGKAWSAANPERLLFISRRSHLKTFGLTHEDYNTMVEKQNNCCAICNKPEKQMFGTKLKYLAIDHNHNCCPGKRSCGLCVRELLCFDCNNMLGRANDSIELLQAAIVYLEKHRRLINERTKT